MASFVAACRLSARFTARQLRQDVIARGFRTSAASLAAHNFTMPALSPTMTEGNIASWKVKEGDSFSAGDILLEIETDKASMDVEAQDDGVVAKIIQGDGSKGIQVGTRIGVLAELGDDISTLEIPPEDKAPAPPRGGSAKSEAQSQPQPSSSSSSSKPTDTAPLAKKPRGRKAPKQTYPLLPSVEHLIHQLSLDASAIENMTPTGPNNRLLKGDVLAYVGSIPESYPAQLSSEIEKRSHLDLSNIKIVPQAAPPAKPSATAEPVIEEEDLEVALPISLKAVLEVQKRIQSTLGVYLPLSTFIARATDVANDDLPRSKTAKPTADELFDEILGLNTVESEFGVRGNFLPQITALPQASTFQQTSLTSKKLDIIDILAGKKQVSGPRSFAPVEQSQVAGVSEVAPVSVFSVTVPKGDEERAEVFLERVRAVLEEEPGRLVL